MAKRQAYIFTFRCYVKWSFNVKMRSQFFNIVSYSIGVPRENVSCNVEVWKENVSYNIEVFKVKENGSYKIEVITEHVSKNGKRIHFPVAPGCHLKCRGLCLGTTFLHIQVVADPQPGTLQFPIMCLLNSRPNPCWNWNGVVSREDHLGRDPPTAASSKALEGGQNCNIMGLPLTFGHRWSYCFYPPPQPPS